MYSSLEDYMDQFYDTFVEQKHFLSLELIIQNVSFGLQRVNQFSFLQLFFSETNVSSWWSACVSQQFAPQPFACSDKDHFRPYDSPCSHSAFQTEILLCHVSI